MKIICRDSLVPQGEYCIEYEKRNELDPNGRGRYYVNGKKIFKVPVIIGLIMIPFLKFIWDYIEIEY